MTIEANLFLLCSFAPLREKFLQKQELANLLRRELPYHCLP